MIVRYITSTGGSTLTIQSGGGSTINGVISGSGGLTFNGRSELNTLTLNGINTFTGSQTTLQGSIINNSATTTIYLGIVASQSTVYGTAYALNFYYSTSESDPLAGVGSTGLPTDAQTFTAGESTYNPGGITGLTGSITLNTALTSTLSANTYSLSLTPSLTK